MGILQDEFDKILVDTLSKPTLVKELLQRALTRRNIPFTDAQLEEASAKIAEIPEGIDEFSFSFDNGVEDQEIDLSEDLAQALSELETAFSTGIEGAIPAAIEETWPSVLAALYRDLPNALQHRRQQDRQFKKRLHARWKVGLDRLEMLVMIAQESGDTFLTDVNKAIANGDDDGDPEQRVFLDALVRIHARSCRIASEVLCLLKSGFADGANARWRSLHENAVIAMFIAQHGSDAAKRYLRHSVVECHRNSASYQQHCKSLGFPPLTSTEVAELTAQYDAALADFGQEFRHEYGWAAKAIGKLKPTFADIEQHLDLDRWRPYFKMACHSVHAGPQGLYFSLGNSSDPEPVLLAGASDAGICDPGHCCAVSLMMVSAAVYTSQSNFDGLVTLKVMTELCKDIGIALLAAHRQLLDETYTNEHTTQQT